MLKRCLYLNMSTTSSWLHSPALEWPFLPYLLSYSHTVCSGTFWHIQGFCELRIKIRIKIKALMKNIILEKAIMSCFIGQTIL